MLLQGRGGRVWPGGRKGFCCPGREAAAQLLGGEPDCGGWESGGDWDGGGGCCCLWPPPCWGPPPPPLRGPPPIRGCIGYGPGPPPTIWFRFTRARIWRCAACNAAPGGMIRKEIGERKRRLQSQSPAFCSLGGSQPERKLLHFQADRQFPTM